MKHFLRALLVAGAAAAAAAAGASDWTPPGPIKMIIGFRAGGGADTHGRLIADELQNRLGWQIIPEQLTGKGGLNMAAEIKTSPNDGTVIGLGVTETFGYNMATAPESGMSPADFTGIVTTAGFQMGIVSLSSKGWASLSDVVAAAKAGEELRFGAMSPRLADLAYLIGKAQGVDFNIVTVRGGRAVMDGVNAGDLDLGFMAGIQASGVASGDLVNLASALSVPLKQSPDAPLLTEFDVPFNSDGYFVFFGPAGMPDEARDRLAAEISSIVNDPASKANEFITRAFGGPATISGDELNALIQGGYEAAGAMAAAAAE